MADDKGTPIHVAPSPTTPHRPDVEREPRPAPCLGCGAHHGGVGSEIHCLRAAIAKRNEALELAYEAMRTQSLEIGRLVDAAKASAPQASCECWIIQRREPHRHFKGCPLRTPLAVLKGGA